MAVRYGGVVPLDEVLQPAAQPTASVVSGTEAVPEQPVAGLAEQRVWRVSRESFVLSCLFLPPPPGAVWIPRRCTILRIRDSAFPTVLPAKCGSREKARGSGYVGSNSTI